MMKVALRIAAAAALVFALAAPVSAQGSARIHLLHGIPDTPVDVIVDGDVVFGNYRYGEAKDLSAFAGQTLKGLKVNAAGTQTTAIDAGDVAMPASGNHTVIAHLDAGGKPTLSVFDNDTSKVDAGKGRLTVRHTAAAPAVDVRAGGQVAFANVTNPNEGSTELAAGTISATVVPTGQTQPVVIGPADLRVRDGQGLIVYAVGSLEGDTLNVLTETVDGIGTAPAAVNTGNSPVEAGADRALTALALVLAAAALIGTTVVATQRS